MKSYLILVLFYYITATAQNYPENLIPKDFCRVNQKESGLTYSLTGNYKYIERLGSITCDGNVCESGTYKRIEFKNEDGIRFYFSGKVKTYKKSFKKYGKFNGKWKYKSTKKRVADIIPNSDVYYESTNHIVSDSRYKNTIHYNHENGKTKYLAYYSKDNKFKYLQVFDKKENIIIDAVLKSYGSNKEIPCPRNDIGKCKINNFLLSEDINLFAKRQSKITHKNGDVFSGYTTTAAYYSNLGYQFSGYILPITDYFFGNGTVLLMTNQSTGNKKWIIYIDGNIVFEMDAENNTSLNIENLHTNLDIDYKTYNYYKNPNLKGKKKDKYIQQGRAGGIAMINIASKNIVTHNGYGMSIKTITENEKDIPYSTKLCQIGFFKNGKLHGIGYKAKIKGNWNKDYNGNILHIGTSQITYEYGKFENGILIDGYDFNGYENTKFNIWKRSSITGIKYVGKNKPVAKIVNISVLFTNIQVNDEIYLDAIKRMVKVKSINKNAKTITVTGHNNEIATLSTKDGKMYLHKILSKHTNKQTKCNVCFGDGIESIPQYKTTYVERSWTTGTMHLHTKDGQFGRGTKTYTSRTPKRIVSNYIKITCTACNGTGKTHYTNTTQTKNLYLINWNDTYTKPLSD